MTSLQATLGHLGTGFLWVVVAGIVWRRRYVEWFLFPVFVINVAVWSVLIAFWHQRFYVQEIWMLSEGLQHFLRLAMALELAIRTFRAFPGAMATLRRVVFVLLAITIAVVLAAAPSALKYETFLSEFQPRILSATIWLFTGIAGLILWYRLPVSAFQKAILLSYVPYLLVFTAFLNLLGALGWERGQLLTGRHNAVIYLNQLAYVALLAYWSYVAWRHEPRVNDRSEKPEPDHQLL